MKNKRNIKVEEKGVTLIALVVTIIVLLILAGISISISLNDKGIIITTREAAEGYRQAEEKEENEIDEFKKQVKNKAERNMIVNVVNFYILYDNGDLYRLGDNYRKTEYNTLIANNDNLNLTLIDTNVAEIYEYSSGSYEVLYVKNDKKCYVRGSTTPSTPSTLVTDSLKSLYINNYQGFTYIDSNNTLNYYPYSFRNIKIADNIKKYGARDYYIDNLNDVYKYTVTNSATGTVNINKVTENVDEIRQQIEATTMHYDEKNPYSVNRGKEEYTINDDTSGWAIDLVKENNKWYYTTYYTGAWVG